jgi:hypothetical protein
MSDRTPSHTALPNNAVEQTAGSHALAAAAHRERYLDSAALAAGVGVVY